MLAMLAKSHLNVRLNGNLRVCFFEDESGVTAIEYALVCGLISVACIGAVTTVGNTLLTVYNGITAALAPAL
jgi:pilus assembly protein Flp/PilA